MGMSYEQFWEQDCLLVIPYRKAYMIRQENQNRFAWLQGMYIYEALCDVSPVLHAFAKSGTKVRPYPDKPYEFESPKKKRKAELNAEKQENAVAFMHKLANRFNEQFGRKREAEKKKLEAQLPLQTEQEQSVMNPLKEE